MQFDYFYGSESEQFTFYRIPKILIVSPQFKRVSDSAKILYGLMLDRMSLSLRSGWFDNEGRAYIFFTLDEIEAQMNCSTGKAVKMLAELDSKKGIGLIERKKQGQGKPTIIYLKKFVGVDNSMQYTRPINAEKPDLKKAEFQTSKNCSSRPANEESTELQKIEGNNNKYNNTDKSNTDVSNINPSYQGTVVTEECASHPAEPERWIDRYNKNIQMIKNNIDYTSLCSTHDKGLLDNCVSIIAEILSVDIDYYTIERQKYPGEMVQMRVREVDFAVLDSFLIHFERRTSKVYNMKSYLITSLFNAPSTSAAQLHNTVAYDMYGDNARRKGGGYYAE